MAQARRFDNNAMLAGAKFAESPGSPEEATMADGREHPQRGTGADRHRWFAGKVFVILAVTIVAAYVTAKLPQPGRPSPSEPTPIARVPARADRQRPLG